MAVNEGVIQLTYVYSLDSKLYTNQLNYVQPASDPEPVDVVAHGAAMAAKAIENWDDNIAPLQANSVNLKEVNFVNLAIFAMYPTIPPAPVGTPQKLMPLGTAQSVNIVTQPHASGVSGDFLPSFNAYRADKQSGRPGRRWRGHISIAGVPESATDGNNIVTGDWTTWQINAPAFLTYNIVWTVGITNYVLYPVVFSVTQAQADNANGNICSLYTLPVVGADARRKVGTMRRRKNKTP